MVLDAVRIDRLVQEKLRHRLVQLVIISRATAHLLDVFYVGMIAVGSGIIVEPYQLLRLEPVHPEKLLYSEYHSPNRPLP